MKQSQFVISTRRDTILTYLHNHGTAKVDELSVLCGVSPLTIRRDLDALEQSNMVIRNFGGVQLMPLSGGITPFEKRRLTITPRRPPLPRQQAHLLVMARRSSSIPGQPSCRCLNPSQVRMSLS